MYLEQIYRSVELDRVDREICILFVALPLKDYFSIFFYHFSFSRVDDNERKRDIKSPRAKLCSLQLCSTLSKYLLECFLEYLSGSAFI